MNKNINTRLYRRVTGKFLDYAVNPKVIGELPDGLFDACNNTEENPLVFYVLQEKSRSNSQLLDNETRKQNLPPALAPIKTEHFNEKVAVIHIQHGKNSKHAHSPRLFRVLQKLDQSETDILLVPVSINWGRDPGKEDSLFKLLIAQSWEQTTIAKQLLNIAVHRRDTYIQLHPSMSLKQMVADAKKEAPEKAVINSIEEKLSDYLDQQREILIGPDLSDRRNEVDNILYSPAIKYAIAKESEATNQITETVRETARGYIDEIATDYSAPVIRAFEFILNRLWTQLYDGVEVHHFDATDEQQEGLRTLAEKYQLIYLPCHRSHIDYLLVLYVLYIRGLRTPYVAAGDNLNLPGVGPILRRAGAFFLRRRFKGNTLYTAVFREYLHSIIKRNIPLKFFIEGGRSRSGRLLPPKTGMLAMSVHSQLRGAGKPIAFIPTYIGYERLAEGNNYVGEMQGKPKEAESVIQLMRAVRKIERIFGVVHVNFGEAIFLQDILDKHHVNAQDYDPNRNDEPLDKKAVAAVHDLSIKTLQNINKAAVINPVSLLSLVLLSTPKQALTEIDCINQLDLYCHIAKLAPYDKRTVLTPLSGRAIINYGLKLKLIKRLPHVMGDMISIADDQRMLLSYFRNNILHAFIMPSMIASLAHQNGRMLKDDILSIINMLYPFLQSELCLKWKQSNIEATVENMIEVMIEASLLQDDGRGMLYAFSPGQETNHQLSVLSTPVQQSLKRYFMTLTLMSQQGSGKMSTDQIIDLCHLLGQRLAVLYDDGSPDVFERNLFKGFISALIRTGYLSENDAGLLIFNERIDNIANNARFVLDSQTLMTIKQIAHLSEAEIAVAMAELEKNKQRRFRKGR